jgi:hypothetical protein
MSAAGEINRIQSAQNRLQSDAVREIARILNIGGRQISDILKGQPTDYQRWILPQVRAEIARAIAALEGNVGAAVAEGLDNSWLLGESLVDAPLLDAGQSILAVAPRINLSQLKAMREFSTDRIGGAMIDAVNKINGQLGLTIIGAQPVSDTVSNVQSILGSARSRAITIVRTEMGTAYSSAAQVRLEQAAEAVPGLQKMWISSGKIHARANHAAMHGQVVDYDEPFQFPGGHEAMYPREVSLPPEERINCGCTSIPYNPDWGLKNPKQE